jgi:Rod binding domain-containing protein
MELNSFNHNLENFNNSRLERAEATLNGIKSVAEVDVTNMTPAEIEAIRAKTQEFESLFIQMMFREMRNTLNPQSTGSNAMDQGRDMWNDMLNEQYSQVLSRSGGIGLADMVFRQLTTPVIPASEIAKRYNNS